ncbi:MAG: hypothetical protein LC747_07380, partial [Acidobacteria bacterium]|nr:hypothetical protein [Acidobacteriota bacterium]
ATLEATAKATATVGVSKIHPWIAFNKFAIAGLNHHHDYFTVDNLYLPWSDRHLNKLWFSRRWHSRGIRSNYESS